ncbi:hypothetical protein [Streptomyces sp. NPDC021608]|uniref:hypothetical protein n=1 Tax=Streptomyces sp. NPDC021608 TaxID=3154903 RepID=UPI0033C0ACF4
MSAHHYVMTVQTGHGRIHTTDGVVDMSGDFTRADCYAHLLEEMTRQHGHVAVLFFALEPNRIAQTA